MLQTAVTIDFNSPDSWVILSSIEQSIKSKIEKVGTPLKDWNIQINYGIKTGCNEAFIISTKKREEILANCSDAEERHRTAELIRPILRGRDIKRYSAKWAGLWLISTFPSRRYDINLYPAVKRHLLSFAEPMLRKAGMDWIADNYLADFCYQKLSQTGKFIEIGGQRVRCGQSDEKSRKETSNKWFETQDSINYWDDFNLPKIIWAELSRTGNSFVLDDDKYFVGNTGYILTSEELDRSRLQYLLGILNSRITLYQIDRLTTRFDDNGWRWLRQFVELLRVPPFLDFERITSTVVTTNSSNQKEKSELLNSIIYEIYKFSPSEIEYINNSLATY